MVILWIQKKYTLHKPNTIWSIKRDSIFDKIGMRTYPQKSFQLHEMITLETNLRENVKWCHLATHVT